MNGCLGKLLFFITLLVCLFLGYPYLKEKGGHYLSDATQDRLHSMEKQGAFVGKLVREIGKQEQKKDQKKERQKEQQKQQLKEQNDNTKN